MTDHQVAGRTVTMPVRVHDASAGTATFLAGHRAARALLPRGLRPVRVSPLHTLVTLVMVDYRSGDLGAYHEMAIQLVVRPVGLRGLVVALLGLAAGRPQTFTVAMPVDQPFTHAAGRQIWGFPKTMDRLDFEFTGDRGRGAWHADGQFVVALEVPRGRGRRMPAPPLTAWTVIDGHLHRTSFRLQAEHGRIGMGGASVDVGAEHALGQLLRRLGLPRRAIMTTWMDDVAASFGDAAPAPRDR